MKLIRKIPGLLMLVFIIVMASGCGGGSNPGGGNNGAKLDEEYTFNSTVVGDSYRIFVALPPDYNTQPAQRYNVLYALDGNWIHNSAKRIINEHRGEIVPLILVSIAPIESLQSDYTGTSPARCRDLTPTSFQPENYPNSGGAENFVKFLETELIPSIDAKYRTVPDADHRGLWGASFGGLFTCYMGIKHPGTFRRYLFASPSLWWDNGVIAQYEGEYAQTHTDLNAMIYGTASDSEGPGMLEGLQMLVALLQSRNYTGLTLYSQTLHGLTHEQTSDPTLEAAVPLLFKRTE